MIGSMIQFIIILLLSLSALAVEVTFQAPPYNLPDRNFQNQKESMVLSEMPPLRKQGNAGHCFAFSTASAIDHFLCSKKISYFDFADLCVKKLPIVSSLHLTSLSAGNSDQAIVEGGFSNGILLTIGQADPYLILETCAPYENYLEYLARYSDKKQGNESLFQTVKRIYNGQLERRYSCGEEFARTLSHFTSNLDFDQIIAFSKDATFEQMLYATIIPKKCHGSDKRVDVFKELGFDIKQSSQFFQNFKIDYEYFYKTVKEQIAGDTPLIINFFVGASTSNKDQVHSALITGIKKVCNDKQQCQTLFKIQNSYGDWWQSQYSDGWVLADPLIERSVYINLPLLWIKKRY